MSSPRAEALPALERWLVRHDIPRESAEANVERVRSFYSAYLVGGFRQLVEVGISARKLRQESPSVLLNMLWPVPSLPSDARNLDEDFLQSVFSKEVAIPGLSAVSFNLHFCDMGPADNSTEELMRRLSKQNKAAYIGILSRVRSPRSWRYEGEMVSILESAQTLTAVANGAVRQIRQIAFGIADKPEAEQRALLKQARGYLVATKREIAKTK